MKTTYKSGAVYLLVSLVFILASAFTASAGDYKSLDGVKSVKAIFDFRDSKIGSSLVHLKLIHDTFKNNAIKAKYPEFVVVFMGPSVTLLSKDRDLFSMEEVKKLDEIHEVIKAMSKDGIRLEVCLFAANFFGIAPDSILPEIHHVGNGWIASMGYQSKGYALIPVF